MLSELTAGTLEPIFGAQTALMAQSLIQDFPDQRVPSMGLQYLSQQKRQSPIVLEDDDADDIIEDWDKEAEDDWELDEGSDQSMDWMVFESWFFSVFWIAFFGIFIWVEIPLNILAMLVHPQSKPHSPVDEDGNPISEEQPDAIQEALNWTIQKSADLMHPYAFTFMLLFTFGRANWEDFELERMTNGEAALYFTMMWFVLPFLIVVNLPMAIILSPIYCIIFLIQVGEWLIAVALDGQEINEKVDEAEERSENDEIEVNE